MGPCSGAGGLPTVVCQPLTMVAIGTRLRRLVGAAAHIMAGSRVNHAVTPVSRCATIRESSSSIALTSGSSGRTLAHLHKSFCTRLVCESPDCTDFFFQNCSKPHEHRMGVA